LFKKSNVEIVKTVQRVGPGLPYDNFI